MSGAGSRWKVLRLGAVMTAPVLIVCAAIVWILLFTPDADVPPGSQVHLEITPGSSTAHIASRLAQEGVITNSSMFRLWSRLAGADGELRAGAYDFVTGSGYGDVIRRMRSGPPQTFMTVTIPEGFTVDDVAERLESAVGIPATQTLELAKGGAEGFADEHPMLRGAYAGSLEGYLFPKTYRIPKSATARQALDIMLDQFDREFAQVDHAAATAKGLSPAEVVVIASVIEREAQLDKERPLVGSVIMNRLDRGMLLEIDATIEYVIPGNHFRLRYRDLGLKSPYNTYLYKGLPPGPISNPGLASLRAAGDPASTDFYFYVLTGKDGSHTFATNKSDFERAKRKSKEVFGR